jgi:DNA repair exonuclease SbcCD ATPase subunit
VKAKHLKDKVDLFNPPKEFNYMSKKLDTSTLDNPYLQVIWEDTADNFTQERIKSVKQYFQKKYSTQNVNVLTKVKNTGDESQQTVDVSLNIMDKNYQSELIKSYLKSKGYEQYTDDVLKIDSLVENKIISETEEVAAFKKWFIKKIEFSNFLSYGENQVLDFTKCDGITVVESDPPNFGGKTVLTVDLLMFLFFNTTTKTSKAEEIFNRFTDKNKVSVRGEITIDGEDYLIVRNLERKLSKAGEWNVKTELDFFKKLSDGQLQNFTGEQRRETEKFIKNSIGEQDDFLMTILTTASNLEDLLDAKPTARGQVLSRFLGLEFLKKKEETGKSLFSEFSKTMMSNVYSTEQLNQDNQSSNESIVTLQTRNQEIDVKVVEVNDKIQKGNEFRDTLISKKHTDIDNKIAVLNPHELNLSILQFESKITEQKSLLKQVKIVEPKEYYHEDKHDIIKESIQTNFKLKAMVDAKVHGLVQLSNSVSGGIKCEHCGIDLMNASITMAKLAELDGLRNESTSYETLLNGLNEQEKQFVQLKKDFDEYEKNKLIAEKYEAAIESLELKLEQNKNLQEQYTLLQSKIEENKKTEETILKANLRLTELNSEKSILEREKGGNEVQIENLRKKIEKNNDIILKIAQEFEREKIYKIYLEVYGKNGISKMIMKTMMPLINSELQRLLQESAYFRLEIRISDKNEVEFIMIDNSTGVEKLMVSGSGYEKTIASLALRAVLSKICSLPKPNIIVFDEVFGKISNDNLEMVGEFFTKTKEYFEKIFVITHNPLVSNWSDNVVKIKKEDNISKVIQ